MGRPGPPGRPTVVGLTSGPVFLPPGTVYGDGAVLLDGFSFDAADSGLANGRQQPRGQGPLRTAGLG